VLASEEANEVGGVGIADALGVVDVLMSDEHRPVSPVRALQAGWLVLRGHGERFTP
jgi:hypothetical protein